MPALIASQQKTDRFHIWIYMCVCVCVWKLESSQRHVYVGESCRLDYECLTILFAKIIISIAITSHGHDDFYKYLYVSAF